MHEYTFYYSTSCLISGKKKTFNLNEYRNNHFAVNNKMKKIFQKWVIDDLSKLKLEKMNKIRLEFTLYRGDKRKTDKANFLSICEKYFCDALVKAKIIDDDNDDIILNQRYNQTIRRKGCHEVKIQLIEVKDD